MSMNNDFVWGTASSAYQIEGAHNRDGKGPSIWDTFTATHGHTAHDDTGETACCHYDLYEEDIKLMAQLGIKAYRFSICWPRVFPNGDSQINNKGLQFYDNVVNCCIANGITPYITLYHWDLPQVLQDKGGWLNRDTSYAFAEYAASMCQHFSDRADNFFTINEPQIVSMMGYYSGLHAPGLKLSIKETFNVLHNLALAHGLAVKAMRKSCQKPVHIGFSSTGNLCYPSDENEDDVNMARKSTFNVNHDTWGFCHTIFCDMTLLGRYPDIKDSKLLTSLFHDSMASQRNHAPSQYSALSFVKDGDIDIMHQTVDFLGLNIYNGHEVNYLGPVPKIAGAPRTALKWPITPQVMNWGVRFVYERYNLPIYITENGLSCNDKTYLDGKVHDQDRIDFLTRYIRELEKASNEGIHILGYFHWSFTDNFEWHSGYDERFGLVYIDYATQQRIPKDSAYWYRDYISQ